MAEKSVGIFKTMMRKCKQTGQDLNLYLLNYRTTPLAGLNYTPSELLMNRKLKSKLPINEKLLDPSIPINPITDMERYQNTLKHKFDKNINRKVKKYSLNDKVLWLKNNQWEKELLQVFVIHLGHI